MTAGRPIGENAIMRAILRVLSNGTVRLFRNMVGQAWQGEAIRTENGVLLRRPRRVAFGMAVGSSDIVGWRSIVITESMLGCRVAQFVALEVKKPGGRTTDAQRAFVELVRAQGGVGGVVRSVEDAEKFLNE